MLGLSRGLTRGVAVARSGSNGLPRPTLQERSLEYLQRVAKLACCGQGNH